MKKYLFVYLTEKRQTKTNKQKQWHMKINSEYEQNISSALIQFPDKNVGSVKL